jgi:hypothetical protein
MDFANPDAGGYQMEKVQEYEERMQLFMRLQCRLEWCKMFTCSKMRMD